MSFDMNALMKQAQEMQAQMQQMQEEAAKETAEASAGGGMVTVVATAGGEIKELRIDPKAIDPERSGDARRPRDGGRERGAARCAREGRGEDEEHAAARPRRPAARSVGAGDRRVVLREAARRRQRGARSTRATCSSTASRATSGLFLVLQGVLLVETPLEDYERGAGQVVGEWEKLDGSEDDARDGADRGAADRRRPRGLRGGADGLS